MNWLIRTIAAQQQDREIEAVSITLGGIDSDIPFIDPVFRQGHVLLVAGREGQVTLTGKNGAQVDKQTLEPGEAIAIGGAELRVVSPPTGFNVAIEFVTSSKAPSIARAKLERDLSPALPSRRAWSYGLMLLLLVSALLIPLIGFFNPEAEQNLHDWGMPTDQFWLSGPLSAAHQTPVMSDNCGACHQKAFEMSPSRACLQCHQKTPEHLLEENHPELVAGHPSMQRCSACHKEHNEPANLIVATDSLCVDCHRDVLPRHSGHSTHPDIASAIGFNREDHPEFKVALLTQQTDGWMSHREPMTRELKEASNLKFPHDVHLDFDKVQGDDGDALMCADCHTLQPDKEHFAPITMEVSCRGCHDMGFDPERDPTAAERHLPHAVPQLVFEHLREFHISKAAQEGVPVPESARRLPGGAKEARVCSDDAVTCGLAQATADMDRLFETAGCVSCHAVYKEDDAWQVKAVRLQTDWRPLAVFDHAAHLVSDEADEQQVCLNCHEANTSDEASDILMPSIDGCTTCHSDQPHAEQQEYTVGLSCIGCHDFHRDDLRAMKVKR